MPVVRVPGSVANLRGLLIDLDGVVYTGRLPIAGAAAFLSEARQRGFPFLLVTNNSSASPSDVAERLRGMDIIVAPEDILTSAQAAVAYVKLHARSGARLLVVGEAGLRQAALAEGFQLVEDGQPADWVVAGIDRGFTYATLTQATRAILNGARFVATNTDALLPIEGGEFLPGAGTMIAAIEAATRVRAVVVGKPEPEMFAVGVKRLGLPASDVAMVGDRIDTDIDGGRAAGLRTILVLSGVTTAAAAEAALPGADVVLPDLAHVAELLGWR